MFAVGIELLMRRAIISRWDKREKPEWPPHPDRVFMALTAAWGESNDPPDQGQRVALEWLESLGAPDLAVPLEVSERTEFTTYVPVNDDASPMGKKGPFGPMGSLAIGRNRQPRSFPAVVPDSPILFLKWDVEIPANFRAALEEMCALVTYLGHSASPVRAWIEDQPPPSTLVPNNDQATHRLRSFGKGRLSYLTNRFEAGLRPQPALWQGYAEPASSETEDVFEGPFDPALIVFRQQAGRKLALESTGMIAKAIRNALMTRCGEYPPEWLSGHAADRSPSTTQRLAYLPLAFVGREHADGHLLGVALIVPRALQAHEIEELYRLLANHGESLDEVGEEAGFLRLWFSKTDRNRANDPLFELDTRRNSQRPLALQPSRWIRPSQRWATVTPVVLPRYPRRELTAEEVVAKACGDAGYPPPTSIRVSIAPFVSGVPSARSFKEETKPGLPLRPLMHVELEFERKVRGPILLGAGRFRGLGAFLPLDKEQS